MLLLALYIEARYVWIPDVPIKLDVHTSRKPIEREVPECVIISCRMRALKRNARNAGFHTAKAPTEPHPVT